MIVHSGVSDVSRIRRAINIMHFCERGGLRHNNVEFDASHQLNVMKIIAEVGIADEKIYIEAALHDTPENTAPNKKPLAHYGTLTAAILGDYFGDTEITQDLEDLSKAKKANDADINPQTYLKLYKSLLRSGRVAIIKMADKLHNMRTLVRKIKQKSREAVEVYARFGHRLGITAWANEIETIALTHLYEPEEMERLRDLYNTIYTPDVTLGITRLTDPAQNPDLYAHIPIHIPGDTREPLVSLRRATLAEHFSVNPHDPKHMQTRTDRAFLTWDIVIDPEREQQGLTFAAYVYTFLNRLGKSPLPHGLRLNGAISLPLNLDRTGEFFYPVVSANGVNLLIHFVSKQQRDYQAASITDLYVPTTPEIASGYGRQKLDSLRANLIRLDPDNRGVADAVVREFQVNLDAHFITIASPEGHHYAMPENSRVIDYAFAAGIYIGAKAKKAVFVYPQGQRVLATLDDVLPDGVVVALLDAQDELIRPETEEKQPVIIDTTFVGYLERAQTEQAKELIGNILYWVTGTKLTDKFIPAGDNQQTQEMTRLEIIKLISDRGWTILENYLNAEVNRRNIWPQEVIVSPFDLTRFDPNTTLGNDSFQRFIRDVGLERIAVCGKRAAYFRDVTESLLKMQGALIRVDMEVEDVPGIARRINATIGKPLAISRHQSEYKINIVGEHSFKSRRPQTYMVRRVINGRDLDSFMRHILPKLNELDGVRVTSLYRLSGEPEYLAASLPSQLTPGS